MSAKNNEQSYFLMNRSKKKWIVNNKWTMGLILMNNPQF